MTEQETTPSAPVSEPTTNTKPIATFRFKGVSASVFENHSEESPEKKFCRVQITRTYKAGDTFKTTNVFGRDELPIVAHVANEAWEYILSHEAASKNGSAE